MFSGSKESGTKLSTDCKPIMYPWCRDAGVSVAMFRCSVGSCSTCTRPAREQSSRSFLSSYVVKLSRRMSQDLASWSEPKQAERSWPKAGSAKRVFVFVSFSSCVDQPFQAALRPVASSLRSRLAHYMLGVLLHVDLHEKANELSKYSDLFPKIISRPVFHVQMTTHVVFGNVEHHS